MTSGLAKRCRVPKHAGLLEYAHSYGRVYLLQRSLRAPWELNALLEPDMVRAGLEELCTISRLEGTVKGIRSPQLKVAALELQWYMRNQLLRDTDWASMAHSIEVRTPFVDINVFHNTVQWAARRQHFSKADMAAAPRLVLPKAVTDRPKTGFSIPVHDWTQKADSTCRRGSMRPLANLGLRDWGSFVYKRLAEYSDQNDNAATIELHDVSSTGAAACQAPRGPGETAHKLNILALLTDAYGATGGIAKFNRDLIEGLCSYHRSNHVAVFARAGGRATEQLPSNLSYWGGDISQKGGYIRKVLSELVHPSRHRAEKWDIIVCGHINLLPIAAICARLIGARLMLIVHGVEAWQPTQRYFVARAVKQLDYIVSVSKVTQNRFLGWARVAHAKSFILPNCVQLSCFTPGAVRADLVERYRLANKRVIMSLGRLEFGERYKGFDEILEVMPTLSKKAPDVVYMIAGEGKDRRRLEEKARSLGVADLVRFTGRITEEEKCDHYRLADAFAMPSRGEGFGIVYLEALACGVPTLASNLDGGREALRDGLLGVLVDPANPSELMHGLLTLLQRPKLVPTGLEYFSATAFRGRTHRILDAVLGETPRKLDLTGRVEVESQI